MRRKKGEKPSSRHGLSSLDRKMIADDASWAQALAMGSLQNGDWQAIIGLTFLPHCARIVHESYTYLTRKSPAAARTVQLQFGAEIEAARHTVKLLDDGKKLYDGVVADFERMLGCISPLSGHGKTCQSHHATVTSSQPHVSPTSRGLLAQWGW